MAVDDWVVTADHGGGYALRAGAMLLPAIIGRSGFIRAADKREGDGGDAVWALAGARGILPARSGELSADQNGLLSDHRRLWLV